MRKVIIYIFIWLISLPVLGQNDIMRKYAATITQDDLKEYLTIIASDALEGRETGTRGQKLAATFIVEEFKRIGLAPIVPTKVGVSYLQKFRLENYDENGIYLKTDNMHYNLRDNILYAGKHAMEKPRTGGIVLLNGDEIPARLNVKNKVHLIIATGSSEKEQRQLAEKAYKSGASMVIIIPFSSAAGFTQYRKSEGRNYTRTKYAFEQTEGKSSQGYFLVSPHIAAIILHEDQNTMANLLANGFSGTILDKINDKGLEITYFTSQPTSYVDTENVLGYLEGSDKKDELVVITAHYDHIGRRGEQINNGADDNGSGTSAVIEIAEAFAQAKAAGYGARRSILFMMVTGEEKGLIGSQYYTNKPIFPLANTVVDLNIDMIGRHDKEHAIDREFVYLVGSDRLSTELHELSEKANSTFTHLSLDYSYNDENHPMRIYYRSDHWNFARHNVPIIFYFNGVHED